MRQSVDSSSDGFFDLPPSFYVMVIKCWKNTFIIKARVGECISGPGARLQPACVRQLRSPGRGPVPVVVPVHTGGAVPPHSAPTLILYLEVFLCHPLRIFSIYRLSRHLKQAMFEYVYNGEGTFYRLFHEGSLSTNKHVKYCLLLFFSINLF